MNEKGFSSVHALSHFSFGELWMACVFLVWQPQRDPFTMSVVEGVLFFAPRPDWSSTYSPLPVRAGQPMDQAHQPNPPPP